MDKQVGRQVAQHIYIPMHTNRCKYAVTCTYPYAYALCYLFYTTLPVATARAGS